jgi:signal transduction histidine kinase
MRSEVSKTIPPTCSQCFIHELIGAVDSSAGLPELSEHLLRNVARLMDSGEGIFCLYDEFGPAQATLASSHGRGFKMGFGIPLPEVSPQTLAAMTSGMPHVVNGAPLPELRAARSECEMPLKRGSNMIIPLTIKSAGLGAIMLWRPEDVPPFDGSSDIERAQLIGRSCALVIQDRIVNERMLHQETFAMFGTVVAGLSHDIKNVLTAIRGGIGIIGMGLHQDNRLSRNTQLLNGLVLNLMDLAREHQPMRQCFSVNDMIERVVALVRPECKTAGIDLEVHCVRELYLQGDPDQIFRVLLNLVQNAVEALCSMDRAEVLRLITISAYEATPREITLSPTLRSRAERWLVLTVSDTGPGIPKEDLMRIWRLSYTKNKAHGTGLGLFISRRIVEDHGGRVYAQSDGQHGATFTILLPHVSTKPVEASPLSLSGHEASHSPPHSLDFSI